MNKDKFLWHLPLNLYKLKVIRARDEEICTIEQMKVYSDTVEIAYRFNKHDTGSFRFFKKDSAIYKENTFAAYDHLSMDYIILTCLGMPIVQDPEVLEELQKINAKLDKIIEGRGYG